jgi:hemoglobin-like flavoprotein
MAIAQRLLVKSNIDSLGANINKLSQIFYRELFHIEMGLKDIFPGNVVFLNRKFANMLGTFKNVEHLEKISASVEKMGERHSQNYAVQLEHFDPIEHALLFALHEYFADEFTVELEAAWHSVFQEVADIMKQAMERVAHQPKAERLHDN